MNALLTLDTTATSGGGQVILRTLAQGPTSTILFCPQGELAREARKYCNVIEIPAPTSAWQNIMLLRQLFRQQKPIEVLHIHGISALWRGVLAALNLPIKTIHYTEHLLTKHYRLANKLNYRIQLFMYRLLIFRVDHIYCVSAAVLQFLHERLHIPNRKLSISYNPLPKLAEAPVQRRKHHLLEIVSTGGLAFIKNFPQLLRVLSKVPRDVPFHATVYGDGTERQALEILAQELGLEKTVTFAGALPHRELIQKLFQADIYIQTSFSESFGYGIAEAMQAGLPVVAFAVGGIPELVQDNISGKLVAPYNESDFADAIHQLLTDDTLRYRLAVNAQSSISRYETE